jgi:hypothetical protein
VVVVSERREREREKRRVVHSLASPVSQREPIHERNARLFVLGMNSV